MKELKYRVWSIKKRKYIDIDTLYCANGKVCGIVCGGVVYDAEDVVLEQDTGLEDKNGKGIYEGDIVEFGLAGRGERGYVAYSDEYASFEVYSKRNFIIGCLFGHAGTVVGNIHENKEFLE